MDATTAAEHLAENLAARLDLTSSTAAAELAQAAGVALPKVRGMLAGVLAPCPRELGRIAAVLNTTPSALLAEPAP